MAVDAQHLTLFSPQFLRSREMMNTINDIGNANMYGGVPMCLPLSGTTTETLLPAYGSAGDSFPAKPLKAESGLSTYTNLLNPLSRKRTRESSDPLISYQNSNQMNHLNRSSFSFLGQDFSTQIRQQQLEIDTFIAQHTQKVQAGVEERRKRNSRRIIAAVEEKIAKKVREKEEEIEKIGKLNWALEEKVKSLCMENQIWRELAQTNEATANALRINLEQVLAHIHSNRGVCGVGVGDTNANAANDVADDAESCCDSSDRDRNFGRRNNEVTSNNRNCKNCGKGESCVLLLPCRHLCLCTICGSSLHTCPVCKSTKNASVHVNMSS